MCVQCVNSDKKRYGLIGIIALLIISEAISALSLYFLNVKNTPYPWSVLTILSHGYYLEVMVGSFIVLFITISLIAYFKRGFFRFLSFLLFALFFLSILSFFISKGLFALIFDDSINNFSIITLFASLGSDSSDLNGFWMVQFASFLLIVLLPICYFLGKLRPSDTVLGDAHFANAFEIQQGGFFKKEQESLIIGLKYGAPLYSNGFEHVLVFAPSGSGKTRSIAIPNLFHYPYSVVCNDVKLTLFETTSGYRQKVLGHTCYCFAPANKDGKTHRYNPLSLISKDKNHRITDIQRIAHILIPDNPKSDPIWTQASRKLFKTLLLYLLDSSEHPTTLGEINRLVKQQQFDYWLQELLDNTDHLDPEFYRNGYSYINNHEKTRSSILETFSGYFELFDDPIIDAATSESDFDLSDLRRKKMTIYIGFTDEDMERLAPILTLFWQQLISVMIREIPDPQKEPYPLLCLIDEFSSLGRIERLRRSLKLLREYRVRCILLFQYIAQTYEKYSHDEARAFTNIKTKIAFATEDINDAEFISKMLGTQTKRIVTWATSHQTQGTSRSRNISYQAIPLLRADEVMKLPKDISIIMRSGFAPIQAKQYVWYQCEKMKNLVAHSIDVPKQEIKKNIFVKNTESYSISETF
ncbi:putative component of type IV secretion system [Legionella micdadei]|uniref:Putative component of type IV secretion system n=1 Tax=Legionella micdadei TaxID=451 RepID=A0A098GJN3_LEGMI|nr:vir protein [Legionella micdadei]CEG62195.1 putative component of type IV secretion system [Legionella micdadei]SCY07747.1 type IV secretion system protein VirD4 [Legionella micdadei]